MSSLKHSIYLSLGSNLGDRQNNLQAAIDCLAPAVQVTACSSIYETPPWGYIDQPAFLNQVVIAETDFAPSDLLTYLKHLEIQLGRQPNFKNGPRLIDLDILYYDDLIIETPTLTIPHPGMAERPFVVVPLADLAPEHRHPVLGRTAKEMMETVNTQGIRLFKHG